MSQLVEILAKIESSGGTIVVRDGQVRARVRPGTLSDRDREILARHKPDLIAMLRSGDGDETSSHSGKTGVVSPSPAEADQGPEVEVVEDLDKWLAENTVPPVACENCGGLDRWEDLVGSWHCAKCDPPLPAQRLRERAARIRGRYASVP